MLHRKIKSRKVNNLMDKLAAQEDQFFKSDFLSPVMRGAPVRVRLSGIIMNLSVTQPKGFEGWGVFTPLSTKTARFVRDPNMQERRQYLDLFPVLRLIICARNNEQWLGIPSHLDTRFKVQGLVPVRLAQEIQMFETVLTRFDGTNCWYDGNDSSSSLRNAGILRDAIAQEIDADKVAAPGLTKEEKQAYAIAFLREVENKKDRSEERIKIAIQRAGGEYRSYLERADSYTVEFNVDGQTHKSVINKETFEVQSAGICLSGYDRNFDLQSLVGVIREGIGRRRINRVGLGDYGHGDPDNFDPEGNSDDEYD